MYRTNFITGVTGMDGSILAKKCLARGEQVIGLVRRSATPNMWRLKDILDYKNFHIAYGDLTDLGSLVRIFEEYKPDRIFNLAAQSFVPYSWTAPISTAEITGLGCLAVLEALRIYEQRMGIKKDDLYTMRPHFYQASSSEMYGAVLETPQTETTRFNPRSPYGCAKCFAYYTTKNYYMSYGIHATTGILFNHEHETRGREFVTRKITSEFARWYISNYHHPIRLGNLDSKRDWGYAEDYVDAMELIIDHKTPGEYVVATNKTYTVRDFCTAVVSAVDPMLELSWKGTGLNEIGYVNGACAFVVDKEFFRPAEVDVLLGDYSKIKTELNWTPKTPMDEIAAKMIKYDIELVKENIFKDA